uniref:HTH CENPB-type domain-containing protein n=1 Tax=Eutreptiella gymnastica TaxID=73025 RepID=A0A7S1NRH2_9EUGL|mmetsp:Transcript_76595/g.135254  ORF Transcript_76595/g.135254 Transcript_76595/m.135254 type:complete len:166 (+) Transcript_76595:53-550(+)
MIKQEAARVGLAHQANLSKKWLERFRRRHMIVLRKVQRRTRLSAEACTERLNKFLGFLYMQPRIIRVWVNYDEMPANLTGAMGNATTLEHRGSRNVIISTDEKHFKRIGTLIVALAVKQDGDLHHAAHLDPAVLIKCRKPKVVSNPKNLLVCTNETGVIKRGVHA